MNRPGDLPAPLPNFFERRDEAPVQGSAPEDSRRQLLKSSPEVRSALREARLAFKPFLAREAARRVSREAVEALHEVLADQEAARDDPGRFVRADISFHITLAKLSGNPIYPALSEAMLGRFFGFLPRLLRAPNAEHLTLL